MNIKQSIALLAASVTLAGALAATATAQSAVSGDAASAAPTAVAADTGEATYQNLCAACHMPDAMGAAGAGNYPALASNPRLIAKGYPLYVVLKGKNGMPPMADMLDDQQVADVVNYVRTHFGNAYADQATATEAAQLR
ncbi:MAG: cytochrome c [Pseudomonadota bacterium]